MMMEHHHQDQDSCTPAINNKQNKAAYNESNQALLTQQLNKITQGSKDDIGIAVIAMRTKGSTQTDEQHRSQTGSRKRSTSSSHGNTNADEEEGSIAAWNKRRTKRNMTKTQTIDRAPSRRPST